MKLSDYVIEKLSETGVRDVFLLSGGGCMHLVESLGNNKEINFVANLHEQACAVAADAYGQFTNELGVALVTTGPGGTNAITGVAASWLDSTPVLVLSGQVKTSDITGDRGVRQTGFQEIGIVPMVSGITKYAVTVTDPSRIRYVMERALHEARNGRPGPVWVDIPLDIQAVDVIPDQLEGFLAPLETQGEPTPAQISQVLNMINESKRPVVLVGNGVRLSKAEKLLLTVLDKLQIPVLTTWKAADLVPDEHLLFVGRPGSIGQRGANFTQQKSDLILVLGARLDAGQTAYNLNNFAPHARKIIVDIDSSELNKFDYQDALLINCSAHNFLEELYSLLLTEKLKTFESWLLQSQEIHTRYPVYDGRESIFPGFVNQYYLIELLSFLCDGKDVFVPGSSGACSEISMQATKLKFGQRMLNSEGLGPMGFGIPAAIGASIASRRRIITIDGDGGFQMNTQELEVIRRLNLSVKIFVLNNNGYGSIRNSQRNYFDSHFVASDPSSGLTLPSVTRIAEAYNIPSIRVDDDKMLAESINWAFNNEGPTIVEVMVSPDQQTMPRTQSYQNEQGIMVTRPMEDLWPFLDRDEFERNLRY